MKPIHSFHIPVMGTGFSIDTPVKVARYGISSVISLVDDVLIEDMRRHYCEQSGETYVPITKEEHDFRARRITEYLNLLNRIVQRQFEELKKSPFEPGSEITKYCELLPDNSPLKNLYLIMSRSKDPLAKEELQMAIRQSLRKGDINVNIMTKLDRPNFDKDGNELPAEYSDALAALRGFAKSELAASIIFSAGFNRRLYGYIEEFKDFYADVAGYIKKKITLKVSDFRSALTQGKFLAKKGIWVSEFRIESGLNCGGHAFASDGFLFGPIMEEFKNRRDELQVMLQGICNEALKAKSLAPFLVTPQMKITAQGGIGTAKEDKFLREFFQLDSTGWGTPFLLVPEVTNVEEDTLQKLASAGEQDVYLSDISPLGVPFHTLRKSSSELEKERRVLAGRPGSPCPKGYLVSNTEFTKLPICTASRQYQKLKLDQVSALNLEPRHFKRIFDSVVNKACICNDLGEGVMVIKKIGKEWVKRFGAVCPGPNIAYFSKIATLKEMVDHIYGRCNLLNETYRPNLFIKELNLYIEYLQKEVSKVLEPTQKQVEYFVEFKKNLLEGIEYYRLIIPKMLEESLEYRERMILELASYKKKLEELIDANRQMFAMDPAAVIS